MVPQSWNGSNFVYYKFIRPFVLRYEDKIESAMNQASDLGKKAMDEGELQSITQPD